MEAHREWGGGVGVEKNNQTEKQTTTGRLKRT